ncbi:cupin domain-containing protein [Paenibacillus polymyxa]|uniref:cupin domain-containing protein n=1 Tax=Paenibacillus TaxID=44249 RepID=UPI0004DF2713|nr:MULTISPECIES: cupin domain-containing protein [Paenibacillus]KAF6617145.1 cupin domain-containing protein [Paenibacillus sp. EKM101P]KAF6621947.1 cupin domain-containing protein [Paenibacillus sp. EKM102P]KAF6631502.1 cupin domain-containing protein [Paenibacillus sp. EKM10P]KAF6649971.1 cupin domain-containing protein [Paenibacillus sp. EKM11P]KAF6659118.1 cupin domain-containing protein [Paenibacillus sp. EKM301P]
MNSYMDYTSPTVQFTYDLSDNILFQKDAQNSINELSIQQLNTLANVSLLDIRLSTANVVEPHYHQNATELIYCISGAVTVSLINPFTRELRHFPITPGQVANVPQGWWHYLVATVDNTHLLAIFNAPVPEFILGSDVLRLTPSNIMAHTYCLDEKKVQEALAPIKKPVIIGPPNDCKQQPPRKPGIHVRLNDTSSHRQIAPQRGYTYTHGYPGFSFNPYQEQD